MKKRKPKKIVIIFSAIIGAGIIIFAFLFYVNVFVKKAPSFENRKFATILHTIEKGQNFNQVAIGLKEKDLINSQFWFDAYFLFSGRWRTIKAGVYDLPYGSTTAQLAEIISKGKIKQEKITILEGWNLMDIANYCEQKGYFTKEEFFEAAGKPIKDTVFWQDASSSVAGSSGMENAGAILAKFISDFNFLTFATSNVESNVEKANDLEGFLYPDTYTLIYPITPEKLIRMALSNFQQKVPLDLRVGDFKATLTMASILEKEVRPYKDKQIVAGILWKRLGEGWPLQVDSTINYALGEFGVKTHFSDLEINSPYNTYKNKGLPPGPICNPGLESLKAAVYYQDSPYWYYLSAKNGQTIFSKTFSQHKAARARYLR